MRKFIQIVKQRLTENISYRREVPRDLFNEANLLKCFGKIYINLESMDVNAELVGDYQSGFNIVQDSSSGNLTIANLQLKINEDTFSLMRPLNSRDAYPLYLVTDDWEEIDIFDSAGNFSSEFNEFLKR